LAESFRIATEKPDIKGETIKMQPIIMVDKCEEKLQQLNKVSNWIEQYRKLWEGRFDVISDILMNYKRRKKNQKNK
jgi:hypothetical protein